MLYQLDLSGGSGGTSGQSVYTAKNGVVVTSSVKVYTNSNYYYIQYLFDGIDNSGAANTYWLSDGGPTVTLDFDFFKILPQINRMNKITLYPRTRDESISDYRILISDDKTAWTQVVARVSNTYANCPYGTAREHIIDVRSRYIRVEMYRSGNWGATMNGIHFLADVVENYEESSKGEAYPIPDAGWKRVEGTAANITYKSNKVSGAIHYNADEITFSFVGTKLRLIYNYNMGNNGDVVYIDGIAYPTSVINTGVASLAFNISGLDRKVHKVTIKTYTGVDWFSQFNALEIGEDDYMSFPVGRQLLTPETGWQRCSDTQLTYPNGFSPYTAAGITNMHGASARILSTGNGQNKTRFRFYGSMLRLLACTYTDRNNNMQVTIDDQHTEIFTSSYSTANIGQVVVFENMELEKGFHSVEITFGENSNGGLFYVDAVDIDADGLMIAELEAALPEPEPGWSRYNDNHPAIAYSPPTGWSSVALVDHYGGSATGSLTTIKDTRFSFSFIGTRIRLIISKSNTYSNNIQVSVDGKDYFFSAYSSYFYHRVLAFEKLGLSSGRHEVVVKVLTKPGNSSGNDFRFDAIDINQDGRLLHPQEVVNEESVETGNRIRCHYSTYRADELGIFSNLGEVTSDFLPSVPAAVPNGDFYLIAVEEDRLGRMKYIADRNIQGGISWQTLNNEGLVTGRELGKQRVATVPVLTSNVGTGVSIVPSAISGVNYAAWKAFNGNSAAGDTNRWVVPNPAPAWLMFSFDKPRTIKEYSLRSHTYNAAAPTAWALQASDNGADWITIDSRSGEQGLLTRRYFRVDNHTGYLFYRFYVTANNGYTGYFLSLDEMQLYEETDESLRTEIRLPTGGVSAADKDNDWDTYVVKSDLGGTATAGDPRVWNWSGSWSHTANTPGSIANRTVRGGTAAASLSSVATTDVTLTSTGFRPVFVKENSYRGASSLLSEIEVRPWADIQTSLHIYRKEIIDPPVARLIDVTVPVTATDLKGYSIEVSGIYSEPHAGWLAFNNNLSDTYAWAPPAGMATGWLIFDYGAPLKIAGYGIASRPAYATQTPRNWTFYGSNDKEKWVVLDSVFDAPAWGGGELRQFTLRETAFGRSYRYFKWEISNSAAATQLSIQEFELYEIGYDAVVQRRTFINVPYRYDLISKLTVKPHGRMTASVKIAPVYLDNLASSIQVKTTSNLIGYISVRPRGKLRGTVAVTPPPIIKLILSPVKDAFVRSDIPRLNYGEEQEMMIGRTAEGEDFRGLIQFDMKTIPAGQRLKSAHLQLYVEQSELAGIPIGFYEVQEEWTEVGVTWASTPLYGRKLAELNADAAKKYAEVDMLDIVRGWYNGTAVNQGIMLQTELALLNAFVRLGTRERGGNAAPRLVLEYYDPNVGSAGFADLVTNLVSQQSKAKDLRTSLTVRSTWDRYDLTSRLKIFNRDMLETYLSVRRDNLLSGGAIRRQGKKAIPSTLTVRERREVFLASRLWVSRDFTEGTGTIRRWGNRDLPANLWVRRSDTSPMPSQLAVRRPNLECSITIVYGSMISSTLIVLSGREEGIGSSITVRQSESYDIASVIKVWANTQLAGEITVKSGYLASWLTVPYLGCREINTTIKVSERFASDLPAALEVIQGSCLTSSIIVEIYQDGTYAFIM